MNMKFARGTDRRLRYERLEAELAGIAPRLGLPEGFALPRFNVTEDRQGRDYRAYYDASAREIAARVFAPELDRLGYDF